MKFAGRTDVIRDVQVRYALQKRIYRRSCPEVFFKNGVLRNFAKFTGKHLCQGFFFNKAAGLRQASGLRNF